MPNLFGNNVGHITLNDGEIAINYMADTANAASNTVRDWITNMSNEWNQVRESITYRDTQVEDGVVFRRVRPSRPEWSFSTEFDSLFDSSEDKNEDIEEENELLDEFLSEFAVKGDDDK